MATFAQMPFLSSVASVSPIPCFRPPSLPLLVPAFQMVCPFVQIPHCRPPWLSPPLVGLNVYLAQHYQIDWVFRKGERKSVLSSFIIILKMFQVIEGWKYSCWVILVHLQWYLNAPLPFKNQLSKTIPKLKMYCEKDQWGRISKKKYIWRQSVYLY